MCSKARDVAFGVYIVAFEYDGECACDIDPEGCGGLRVQCGLDSEVGFGSENWRALRAAVAPLRLSRSSARAHAA